MTYLVGVLELSSKYRYGVTSRGAPLYLFRPYDEDQPDMIVGCSHRDTSRDQIAIVEPNTTTTQTPGPTGLQQKPRGILLRLIGQVGSEPAERTALLEHYCPTRTYTKDLPPVNTSDDAVREELSATTGWLTFHIDPPGCRDIDDALAWHTATRTWAITIADAAAFVPFESPLNAAARNIGETFYNTTGTVQRPMLPSAVSEEQASLLPGTRRRGVTYFFGDGADNNNSDRWALTWITVTHSFTYDTFAGSDVARTVGVCATDPHEFIADMMVRYNRRAAELLRRVAPAAGILRVQSAPDAAAVASWSAIDPALARMAHEAATYAFVDTDGTPGAQDQSHAGLGLNAYCHASSPLRRYADLANQRLLKAHITGDIVGSSESVTLTEHLNARTRAARRWARDLLFLEQVTPGRVHEIAVVWVDDARVWVPAWGRLLRLRHTAPDPVPAPGTPDNIRIFCDPTKRNWRRRILTAPATKIANTQPTPLD